MPLRKDWRIGTIGAGAIVRGCHLVAYRMQVLTPTVSHHSIGHTQKKLQMNLIFPMFMTPGNN